MSKVSIKFGEIAVELEDDKVTVNDLTDKAIGAIVYLCGVSNKNKNSIIDVEDGNEEVDEDRLPPVQPTKELYQAMYA
jgi:hypothetical protein